MRGLMHVRLCFTGLLVVLAGTTAFLALAPINLWAASAAAAVLAGGTAVALLASMTSIVITGKSLQVGRARIERRFVGEAEAFRGDEVRLVRGPGLDGRAFMNFRVSVGPVVRIRITDPVLADVHAAPGAHRRGALHRRLRTAPLRVRVS